VKVWKKQESEGVMVMKKGMVRERIEVMRRERIDVRERKVG
jgi:hypothetical protein